MFPAYPAIEDGSHVDRGIEALVALTDNEVQKKAPEWGLSCIGGNTDGEYLRSDPRRIAGKCGYFFRIVAKIVSFASGFVQKNQS